MSFDHEWFRSEALSRQREEAVRRCVARQFPEADAEQIDKDEEITRFRSQLDVRTLIYLRDGFSYEVRELADVESESHLVFECEPVDEHYKVGAFVVTLPFDEIVRVEVFAVHPSQKPNDLPQITGFRGQTDLQDRPFPESTTSPYGAR